MGRVTQKGPIGRMIEAIREFGNRAMTVRVKWFVAGSLLFVGSVGITQAQFNSRDARERAKVVAESENRDFVNAVTTYNAARVAYGACVDSVIRSDANRSYQTALLEKIIELFPDSVEARTFVNDMKSTLNDLLPPRTMSECVDPGLAPSPPSDEET